MAVPMISTGFGDLVDRRITKIFYDEYDRSEERRGRERV